MDFNLRQLETFLWVAALGNFRKAAEKLHTTQPAIQPASRRWRVLSALSCLCAIQVPRV